MPTFQELKARLEGFEVQDFGSGASEADIDSAEVSLGVALEGGYRAFLTAFGWGGVEHLELYGLGNDVPPYLDLVAVARSERTEMEPVMPRHLVPVMNDGAGNHHCLDTRRGPEPPVVRWDHEAGEDQEPWVEAPDFTTWLSDRLDTL